VLVVVLVLVLDAEFGSKASRTSTSTSTKDVVIRNFARLVRFLFRSDWTLAASGIALMKLHRLLEKT